MVLPVPDRGKNIDRIIQLFARMAAGIVDDFRLLAAQERICRLFPGRWWRAVWAILASQVFHDGLAFDQRLVARFDGSRKTDIVERVFVPAIDMGLFWADRPTFRSE